MAVDLKVEFENGYKRYQAQFSPAAFNPAADLILRSAGVLPAGATADDVKRDFDDYFTYGESSREMVTPVEMTPCKTPGSPWPIPPTCVRLDGSRGALENYPRLNHLFLGDAVWLHYMEQMGLFKIVQVLLDDYETKGQHPFDRTRPYIVVLEAMTRERRAYVGSRTIDRENLNRRLLGWTYNAQAKTDPSVNSAFADHFDALMALLGRFYATRDLAVQLKESIAPGGPSAIATVSLTAIQDAIQLLRRAMRTIEYGRNYTNTLVGIVWSIAAFALTRDVREVIGIPEPFDSPDQYIPAAYDLLVAKTAATPTRINRYLAYRHCADHARDILIDIEVLETLETSEDVLRAWLDSIDTKVLAYAAAYKALFDVDVTAGGRHKQRM